MSSFQEILKRFTSQINFIPHRSIPFFLHAFISWIIETYIKLKSMGCVDSAVHTPSLFTSMKAAHKEALRDIIARDDICALVQFDSVENCPSNVELSESGIRWTTLHFCCRFDSPVCLDYFLKKCFLQAPTHYPFFVNLQTAEGLSCLHLCGVWSAYRCAVLLLRYGAINLSLRDKRHKTAETVMGEYGMKEMERLLGELKAKEGWITGWNLTLLQQLPDIPALRETQFYKEQIIKMDETLVRMTDTTHSAELSTDEKRLREEKQRSEKQREQLHQKIMKLQKQSGGQQQKRKNEQGAPVQKEETSPEILDLQRHLKQKEQQIERFKYNISKLNSQKIDELLEQQVHKLDFTQAHIAESFKQLTEQFQQFKQNLLKNRQQFLQVEARPEVSAFLREPQRKTRYSESSSKWAEAGSIWASKMKEIEQLKKENGDRNIFNRLPQHIQERYRKAKQQGQFQDDEFPHTSSSLGGAEHENKIKPFLSSLLWLRPSQFLSADFQLFDGIDPNDIKQGQLGVCYCLATISEYARSAKKIAEMFAYADLELGFYVLRFFTNGKPNYIVVDDYFPCSASSRQPLFSKPIGNQIWVLLIEKAWAKVIGSYFAAELMTPDLFMEDLTGSPTYGAWFKDKKDKMGDIITCSAKNYLIVLTTGNRRIQGIVNNHAYSLLKVIPYNDTHIYKLRNPWGRFEWNGTYGEQSTFWVTELKKQCEEIDRDDGIFFLSESEVLQAFDYYSIGLDQPAARYSYLEFTSGPEQPLYFRFRLERASMMSIRITQPFKRIVKDKDYKYSPVILEVGRVLENRTVTFLSEGSDKCYFGEKSVYATNDIYRHYDSGDYFIRVKMQWATTKYNSAVISVYCDEEVQLQRVEEEEGLTLWNKMLLNYVQGKRLKELNEDISYLMEWMRGQMICYAVLRDTSKQEAVKVKWTFNPAKLQNCCLANNKTSDATIEFPLTRVAPRGFGTLNRMDISKSCKSGSVSIHSLKS